MVLHRRFESFLFSWHVMSSKVTGNGWSAFDLEACERPFRDFPYGIGLPCLSVVDLHSLVQCCPLPHLLHVPEGWGLLFLPFPDEILFLEIPCLQSLFRCSNLPELKHLAGCCPLIALEITSPTPTQDFWAAWPKNIFFHAGFHSSLVCMQALLMYVKLFVLFLHTFGTYYVL